MVMSLLDGNFWDLKVGVWTLCFKIIENNEHEVFCNGAITFKRFNTSVFDEYQF
jgi:hypothetical protein